MKKNIKTKKCRSYRNIENNVETKRQKKCGKKVYRTYKNVEKLEYVVNGKFTIELCSTGVCPCLMIFLVTVHCTKRWIFYQMSPREEAGFRHILLQINADAQGRPKTATTNAVQQRINTLNERYKNNETTLNELLDDVSLTVTKETNKF